MSRKKPTKVQSLEDHFRDRLLSTDVKKLEEVKSDIIKAKKDGHLSFSVAHDLVKTAMRRIREEQDTIIDIGGGKA